MDFVITEKAIRSIVKASVDSYSDGFRSGHIKNKDNPESPINSKIHNIFISTLGDEVRYYSALVRSLDSSLGNMLESMAIAIARLNYKVEQHVEGNITDNQIIYIAQILEKYKNREKKPSSEDYQNLLKSLSSGATKHKRHESDYYIYDEESNTSYLIELKIGGDLDNKKARSEKESLLEQFAILSNTNPNTTIKIKFATAYNRYGEGREWKQSRVRQFFSEDELMIGKDFWDFICKSQNGFNIVIDEYKNCADTIKKALEEVKLAYIKND